MQKGRVLTIILVVVVIVLLIIIALHFIVPKGGIKEPSSPSNTPPVNNQTNTTPPSQSDVLNKKVYALPDTTVSIRSNPSVNLGFFGWGSNEICSDPDGQQLLDIVNQDNTSVWSEGYWWGGTPAWYKIKIDNKQACGGASIGYVLADEVTLK